MTNVVVLQSEGRTRVNGPKVTFVIPCYNLARFLPTCINSILGQSFADFEILVMDDCSPDNTAEVARSYHDTRVRHVRNKHNLGHLRNYNKGIGLSQGSYVWLISADDYLRSPVALAQYVALADGHPRVGYVFCPGYGVRDGIETEVYGRLRVAGDRDRVLSGGDFLKRLLRGNFVPSPSGMVRRECYENLGAFPLNMPWCGDWYMWCLFALHYDVGYLSEPMVCYREQHPLSMTDKLTRESMDACGAEEILVSWRIREEARRIGNARIARESLTAIAYTFARTIASLRYRSASSYMNFDAMETSLRQNVDDETERRRIRARVFACVGNECYWRQDVDAAKRFYMEALAHDPWMPSIFIKAVLSSLGKTGSRVRRTILSLR